MKTFLRIILLAIILPLSGGAFADEWYKIDIDTVATANFPAHPRLMMMRDQSVYILRSDTISYMAVQQHVRHAGLMTPQQLDSGFTGLIQAMPELSSLRRVSIKEGTFKGYPYRELKFIQSGEVERTLFLRMIIMDDDVICLGVIVPTEDKQKVMAMSVVFFNSLEFTHQRSGFYSSAPMATQAYHMGYMMGRLLIPCALLVLIGVGIFFGIRALRKM